MRDLYLKRQGYVQSFLTDFNPQTDNALGSKPDQPDYVHNPPPQGQCSRTAQLRRQRPSLESMQNTKCPLPKRICMWEQVHHGPKGARDGEGPRRLAWGNCESELKNRIRNQQEYAYKASLPWDFSLACELVGQITDCCLRLNQHKI